MAIHGSLDPEREAHEVFAQANGLAEYIFQGGVHHILTGGRLLKVCPNEMLSSWQTGLFPHPQTRVNG